MKFIHTADFHLGHIQRSLIGPNITEIRFNDFFNNLNEIIQKAISEEVDFFIIAGDVFNSPRPQGRIFVRFSSLMGKLLKHGVKVLIVAGNHDKPRAKSTENPLKALGEMNPNFIYMEKHGSVILRTRDGEKVGFVFLPYLDPRHFRIENKETMYPSVINRVIREELDKISGADFRFLIGHIMLANSKFTDIFGYLASDIPVNDDVLEPDEFDYIALGHVHTPQKIGKNIYYSGSIERIDFREANENKAYILGSLGNSSKVDIIPLKCREMRVIGPIDIDVPDPPIDIVLNLLEGKSIEKGDLVQLKIISSRKKWIEFRKRYWRLENYLLKELKVAGFAVKNTFKHVSSEAPQVANDKASFNIIRIFEDYIRKGRGSEKAKEIAIRIGKRILEGDESAIIEA